MCIKVILVGNTRRETDRARQIMDASGVSYEFEPSADPQERPTLITPGGRYCGVETISRMFGDRPDLHAVRT
jgi:hypothetical protein